MIINVELTIGWICQNSLDVTERSCVGCLKI